MNTTQWWVLGTGIATGLAFLALGFAAMSINPPHKVPGWLPKVFFVLAFAVVIAEGIYFRHISGFAPVVAGIGVITLLLYVFWAFWASLKRLPRAIKNLRRLRLVIKPIPAPHNRVNQLEHDGVIWQDIGVRSPYDRRSVIAEGPFCPDDLCELSLRDQYGREHVKASSENAIGRYGVVLFCQQCGKTYTLGSNPKTVGTSRDEVETLFEAEYRRKGTS